MPSEQGLILQETLEGLAGDQFQRLERLFANAAERVPRHRLELYTRTTRLTRIRCDATGSESPLCDQGFDQGVALRLVSEDARSSFASASGGGDGALDAALDRALAGPWSRVGDRSPWAENVEHRDLEPAASDIPWSAVERRRESLDSRLDQALGQLIAAGRDPEYRWEVQRGAADTSETVEAWMASGGLRALRSRRRHGLDIVLKRPAGDDRLRCRLASRRVPDARTWIAATPRSLGTRDGIAAEASAPCIVPPILASDLVRALAARLHGEGCREVRVGPGWQVTDDPGHAAALSGGTFDDAGFPSGEQRLADGVRVLAPFVRRGALRRGSFRDLPAPYPTHLVVAPGAGSFPDPAWVVTELRIDPLATEWLLHGNLQWVRGGNPQGRPREATIRATPEELALCCRAALGEGFESPQGVDCPWLVFDGLALRFG